MAQTQKPTKLGYGEAGRLLAGEAASAFKSIVGLTGACTASEDSTFINPGGATKLAANGFALADADSVIASDTSVTDDTVEVDHVFTASGAQSVSGFAILNDDDDVVYMEVCFNAALEFEENDTLTCEGKYQLKLGS